MPGFVKVVFVIVLIVVVSLIKFYVDVLAPVTFAVLALGFSCFFTSKWMPTLSRAGNSQLPETDCRAAEQRLSPRQVPSEERREPQELGPTVTENRDEPDAPSHNKVKHLNDVKQAVKEVFNCSYSQFILLWYKAPEDMKDQVLYQVFLEEFNLTVDHVAHKTAHLESKFLGTSVVQILTRHLQNLKNENISSKQVSFQSREEELALCREFSKNIVTHLLPSSLSGLRCTETLLNEVFALKILEPVISLLSDPDFFNRILVNVLDIAAYKTQPLLNEMVLCNTKDERETENTTREEEMTKKKMEQKGVKAKQFFKKVANKMKKKTKSILDGDLQKPDKQEGSTFYFRSALKDAEVDEGLLQDDDRSSEEGLDTDGNISDSDACMEFEPVNPFHVWQVGYWKAEVLKIFNAEKSFRCVILVKDAKNPEIMNWKIKKDLCEFVDLQKNLSKTYPDLQQYDFVSITQQLESQNEPEDSELTEKIKSILNEFLEKLLINTELHQNNEVSLFLSPADPSDEDEEKVQVVSSFLNTIMSYLFPEDILEEENKVDANFSSNSTNAEECLEPSYQTSEQLPCNKPKLSATYSEENSCKSNWIPKQIAEAYGSKFVFRTLPIEMEKEGAVVTFRAGSAGRKDIITTPAAGENMQLDVCGKKGVPANQYKKTFTKTLQESPSLAVYLLIKEIFDDSSSGNNFLKYVLKLPKLEPTVNKMFQNKVDQLFTESSFASYINFLQQILWPGGKPAASSPPRTEEEKIETKKKAEELLLKRIPTAVLKILFKNPKSKIRFVLSVFQDNEANKRLIYMLLFFLLGEIIPELKTTLKSEHIPWLKNIVE